MYKNYSIFTTQIIDSTYKVNYSKVVNILKQEYFIPKSKIFLF